MALHKYTKVELFTKSFGQWEPDLKVGKLWLLNKSSFKDYSNWKVEFCWKLSRTDSALVTQWVSNQSCKGTLRVSPFRVQNIYLEISSEVPFASRKKCDTLHHGCCSLLAEIQLNQLVSTSTCSLVLRLRALVRLRQFFSEKKEGSALWFFSGKWIWRQVVGSPSLFCCIWAERQSK